MKQLTFLIVSFFLTSCTDAEWDATLGTLGDSAAIECFSGGKNVFSSVSTGKVTTTEGGGFVWRTKAGNTVKTFADCFVVYSGEK